MAKVQGWLSVNARGFGFLEWMEDGARRSAFVPPPKIRPFLHLDVVKANVVEDDKGLAAKDLELLSRRRDTLFGEVVKQRGKLQLQPDPEVANSSWRIDGSDVKGLKPGMHVVARLKKKSVHVLHTVPEDELALQRVRDRYLIRHPFPDDVLEDAKGRRAKRTTGWRDLRDLTTITIDAPSSKDLDDALSVMPATVDGALRVFVHIADVDSVVQQGTKVDEEARKRGTSVYLAGAVTPMLPRTLSEDRLSLLPGQDRRAMTVEMRIDAEGEVTSVDLYPSTIRSNTRLSYEEVDDFLMGDEPDLDDDVLELLAWMRTVYGRLSATRAARGGVNFNRAETHIELDEEMEPIRIYARRETTAHLLIERTMVAANEAVARWLDERGLPGVFRIHPAPAGERIDELEDAVERMGFTPGLADPLTPRGMAALEAQFSDTPLEPVLQEILGQVLEPARYTVHPGPHFGLGSERYLHFTSPIRRYADLAVHRVVKAFLEGDRALEAGDEAMEELAVHLTDCARRSKKAENARRRMLTARWAKGQMDESFSAHVVAVKPFGLILQFDGMGVSGAIPTETLGGSWKHEGHQLVGKDKTWAIGDQLDVRIDSVDEERGRIDLAPLEPEKKRRKRRGRRRRRRSGQ